jgi:hypothetical protein
MRIIAFVCLIMVMNAYNADQNIGETGMRTDTMILGIISIVILLEPLLGAIFGKRK